MQAAKARPAIPLLSRDFLTIVGLFGTVAVLLLLSSFITGCDRQALLTASPYIDGLLLGGIYGLAAIGFSIVWGILNIINLAHGVFIMLGAYITFWLWERFQVDPFLTIPVSVLFMFGLGYLLQRLLINQVIRAPLLVTLLLTFGLEIFFINLAEVLWTPNTRGITTNYGQVVFLGTTIPWAKIITLLVAVAVTIGLFLFMSRTRTGQGVRAVGMDIEAARLVGIKIGRSYALTYAIGAGLAAVAGLAIAVYFPFVFPRVGVPYTIQSFVIVVLGGLGSIPAALVGAVTFGVISSVGQICPGAGWSDFVTFAVLVLVLIFRPQGLMGKEYYF